MKFVAIGGIEWGKDFPYFQAPASAANDTRTARKSLGALRDESPDMSQYSKSYKMLP